ncbi:MAG: hypothetical protein ACFFB3_15505 [Candidatus Hodarchaeota archaeon]
MSDLIDDYYAHFDEYKEDARRERKQSVDWGLVRRVCSPAQVEAIELFVERSLLEGAASIAGMSVLELVQLLQRLGISRA